MTTTVPFGFTQTFPTFAGQPVPFPGFVPGYTGTPVGATTGFTAATGAFATGPTGQGWTPGTPGAVPTADQAAGVQSFSAQPVTPFPGSFPTSFFGYPTTPWSNYTPSFGYSPTSFGATGFGGTSFGGTPFGYTPTFGATGFGGTPFGYTPTFGTTPTFGATGFGGTPFGYTPSFGTTPTFGATGFGGTPFGYTPSFGTTPTFGATGFGGTPFGYTPSFGTTPTFGATGFGGTPFGYTPSFGTPFSTFGSTPWTTTGGTTPFGFQSTPFSTYGTPSSTFGTPFSTFGSTPWTTTGGTTPFGFQGTPWNSTFGGTTTGFNSPFTGSYPGFQSPSGFSPFTAANTFGGTPWNSTPWSVSQTPWTNSWNTPWASTPFSGFSGFNGAFPGSYTQPFSGWNTPATWAGYSNNIFASFPQTFPSMSPFAWQNSFYNPSFFNWSAPFGFGAGQPVPFGATVDGSCDRGQRRGFGIREAA